MYLDQVQRDVRTLVSDHPHHAPYGTSLHDDQAKREPGMLEVNSTDEELLRRLEQYWPRVERLLNTVYAGRPDLERREVEGARRLPRVSVYVPL